MEEVFDEVFFDAGEEGEFFDGDEFVFGFAEGGADLLEKLTGGAATTAGDILNVFGIEYNTDRDLVGYCFHGLPFGEEKDSATLN